MPNPVYPIRLLLAALASVCVCGPVLANDGFLDPSSVQCFQDGRLILSSTMNIKELVVSPTMRKLLEMEIEARRDRKIHILSSPDDGVVCVIHSER